MQFQISSFATYFNSENLKFCDFEFDITTAKIINLTKQVEKSSDIKDSIQ